MGAELIGWTFGRLGVYAYAGVRKELRQWNCVCVCGREVVLSTNTLRSGHTSSCGCLRLDRAKAANTVHGHARECNTTRTYNCWRNMIHRCHTPTHRSFPYYGARGIKVCERWHDYANFLADMGEAPPRLEIDRINNDGDYEPGNCRWATRSVQNSNKRSRQQVRDHLRLRLTHP